MKALLWPLFVVTSLWLSTALSMESYKAEDGYEVFPAYNQSRYKLSTVVLPWSQALSVCQGDGGGSVLAVINSKAEAEVYKQVLTGLTGTGYFGAWVGITDVANEGYWLTIQGVLLASSGYAEWGWEQPNDGTRCNCGTADVEAHYCDDPCSYPIPFVCEKPNV